MLHSIFTPKYTNLIRNRTTHQLISMSTQTIRLTSSRHCQGTCQNEQAMFHPIKHHLRMPQLSITMYSLPVGTKKILLYQQDFTPLKKVRQRKIIWFNPPYNGNMETNIGKTFLNLIAKHFPNTSKFHKIFNKTISKLATVVYLILPT